MNATSDLSLKKLIKADAYSLIYMKSAAYKPSASLKVLKMMLEGGMGGYNQIKERRDALTPLLLYPDME